jgi:hypothetical protein
MKPCYYCGAPPPSSREHVPPKMLFKETEFSAISVPSCEKHNYEKHALDQGFVAALAIAVKKVREMVPGIYSVPSDDIPVLDVPEGVVRRVGTIRSYILDTPADIDTDLPYIDSIVDLHDWIRHISAGLLWARLGPEAVKLDWDEAFVRSPNLVQIDKPVSLQQAGDHSKFTKHILELSESIDWYPGWFRKPHGYPQCIYHFSISSLQDPKFSEPSHLIFRHEFFRSFTFFLYVECDDNIKDEVIK